MRMRVHALSMYLPLFMHTQFGSQNSGPRDFSQGLGGRVTLILTAGRQLIFQGLGADDGRSCDATGVEPIYLYTSIPLYLYAYIAK